MSQKRNSGAGDINNFLEDKSNEYVSIQASHGL